MNENGVQFRLEALEKRMENQENLNVPVTQEQVKALHVDLNAARATMSEDIGGLSSQLQDTRRILVGILITAVFFAAGVAATAIQVSFS